MTYFIHVCQSYYSAFWKNEVFSTQAYLGNMFNMYVINNKSNIYCIPLTPCMSECREGIECQMCSIQHTADPGKVIVLMKTTKIYSVIQKVYYM